MLQAVPGLRIAAPRDLPTPRTTNQQAVGQAPSRSVRGKPRVTAEWMLVSAVTNLFKAISSGHLTAAAPAKLTAIQA